VRGSHIETKAGRGNLVPSARRERGREGGKEGRQRTSYSQGGFEAGLVVVAVVHVCPVLGEDHIGLALVLPVSEGA